MLMTLVTIAVPAFYCELGFMVESLYFSWSVVTMVIHDCMWVIRVYRVVLHCCTYVVYTCTWLLSGYTVIIMLLYI